MNENMNESTYNDNDIKVLKGLEAVRKRPGMYIGSTSSRGLHHLVWEIVDNSIDEALAGYSDIIKVFINKDNSITVIDNGRGIPTGIHPKTGVSTIETVFTVLHAGGKFGGGGYKVSGGLHGVGASVVNALSSFLEIKVYQNGSIYSMSFKNGGKDIEKLKVIGEYEGEKSGTEVTFRPDPEIFTETTEFDYDILRTRLRELAFLNKGLKIILTDERRGEDKKVQEEFMYEGGIKEYVKMLNKNKTPLTKEIVDVEGEIDEVIIEVALQYNKSYSGLIYSFVNNINTHEGGTHEDGVKQALTKEIKRYAKDKKILKEKDEPLIGDDVREGLAMIISCKHPNPQFEGQTKTKLGNSEVKKIASSIFSEGFRKFLLENPNEAKIIVEKAMAASKARIAAKKARELTRRKGGLELTTQWGKLTDCSSKDVKESELFIVEGNSAAGPAKQGRDSRIQAVLPIRGKIINVEKSRLDKILANEEIRSLITAFGTGVGEEFDIEKLRYNKIIIMTDADVDGAHIRTLLLTFFYRYFEPLVENGHIYAAQPPLFKISHGKTNKYVLDQEELDEYVNNLSEKTKYDISRMKGLGEMDPIELKETTMDIKTRNLLKIELDDAILADETFQILMGEDVAPRRKFIEDNALNVRNLDV
ncbi:DNA topoisomerase (ATP-hydrolyzing) subunit B [Methanobrevibacter sp. TMH8]|uniref:DNA topoisomerase (ATP-hydrolyzing) subunit B n=1 Tax=Methanobrevibacter sp. TMH8 TaxID=2848611 RepID=UPI001CC8FB27|nr:DNA topoisomerase (ATP-hydrolyzing) subunit B [Methanobrevibacter sp. TMH8]MBZ9570070.1 DNA topoisomerase (ATP-hydrolyzing) subunit B [Methanobrevibacter sp. TMH8]